MDKNSKIYVAGHNGMVGSAIVRELKKQGYTNLILKSHNELDLTNQADVEKFFASEKPEYVFLAAAKVGGIVANNSALADFMYDNMILEMNVIHSAWKNGCKKLEFLGSSCIYPRMAPQPLKEEYLLTGELEKFAKDMIKSKFEPGNLVGGGFNYIVEIEHLLKDLPDRLNSTLDKLERGELELNMNHTGLDELKDQLSISLIVSALLVGSSIAILADKGPRVWDISAIGFFGFLISAILGVYIIIKFIRTEK